MATYHHYHVRVLHANGTRVDGGTCFGLAKSVKLLNQLTGFEWPYQVIHRILKNAGTWCEAFTAPALGPGSFLAVVEDAGQLGTTPKLWPKLGGVQPNMATAPLALISWTDEDFAHAKFYPDQKPLRLYWLPIPPL